MSVLDGTVQDGYVGNMFHRWNTMIDKNNFHHGDINNDPLYENDHPERQKRYLLKDKDVIGEARVVPHDDDDGALKMYDDQGESAWNHHPDPNQVLIDHEND